MKAIFYIAIHRIYNRWSQLLITVGYCANARMRKQPGQTNECGLQNQNEIKPPTKTICSFNATFLLRHDVLLFFSMFICRLWVEPEPHLLSSRGYETKHKSSQTRCLINNIYPTAYYRMQATAITALLKDRITHHDEGADHVWCSTCS